MNTSGMTQAQIADYKKLLKESKESARKEAEYRKSISESIEDYVNGVKEANKLKKEFFNNEKKIKKIQEELNKNSANMSHDELVAANVKLEILQKQNKVLREQHSIINNSLTSVNKSSLIGSKILAETVKGLGKIPSLVQQGFGTIKGLGLFEMDKSIKTSALNMGLLSKQTDGFRKSIISAGKQTALIGFTIDDMSVMQSSYSEELGRSVVMTEKGMVAMGRIAKDTGMSAENAGRLAAEMDSQGLSAEKTSEFITKSMNSSHKMGLNSSKVIKNITGNIKMLNRYNFKNGVDGLTKMAQTVAKLGVGMEFAAGFADKLWDVEGAVDMSAQLQVMGGEWAKMADPFKLMYQARNDIQGLTEDLGRAAAASAHLNSKGEIEMSALEMHKLKTIAQQTGIAYDDLVQAGKNAFKLGKIKTQVQFDMSDEEKEFLANQAQLDKDGKAFIMVKGDKQYLNALGKNAKATIEAQMKEEAQAGERAKAALSFDEALANTLNQMKINLMPLIDIINRDLLPWLKDFSDNFDKNGWGKKIEDFASQVGELISWAHKFVVDNPIKSAIAIGAGFFADKAMWLANGFLLAQGFNAGTKLGDGSLGGSGGFAGKLGKYGNIAKIGGGLVSAGASGYDEWTNNKEKGVGTGENLGRTGIRAGASGLGAWGGAALGAQIGLAGGPIGVAIGGIIGGLAGGLLGDKLGDIGGDAAYGVHDGKFSGIGKNLGSDFSKGRGVIQGGKITPIDNKDDLLAMKPGGPVDKAINNNDVVVNRVEFSNITIDGEIRIVSPGQPGLVIDLMKDQAFKRDITRTIQVELEKNKIGGKNKG